MTFDDGIIKFYTIQNTGGPGSMPSPSSVLLAECYFKAEMVGINRYYTAKANGEKVDKVVDVWPIQGLDTTCTGKIGDEVFKVLQIQELTDDDGLDIYRVSLEKVVI